jgi:hypothetical protein
MCAQYKEILGVLQISFLAYQHPVRLSILTGSPTRIPTSHFLAYSFQSW